VGLPMADRRRSWAVAVPLLVACYEDQVASSSKLEVPQAGLCLPQELPANLGWPKEAEGWTSLRWAEEWMQRSH
jgi:hypothetical protein